ncbi:MAG: site-2 protease family protein [Rhodocyclaceae bacterium]|nr:site-2 protease family protein [Rhodocyclaceae bacterium]
MDPALIQKLAVYALPVIFAITLHEAAHGYVAKRFGDKTAWMLGRVTLNPLKHIDPVGTVLVPVMIVLMSSGDFLFGWAKPVPVNFGALRRPKKDMLWVAAAGPGANFLMVLGWALLFKLALVMPEQPYAEAMKAMGRAGVGVNTSLMLLNLLPLPPLDGGRIAVSLLPMRAAVSFSRIEPYGMWVLLLLLFWKIDGISILGYILYVPQGILEVLVMTIFGLR